jgi:uncharacterized membrane protein YuzA (DUF378 family)
MKIITIIATILLIAGGLNWGLVGLFNLDLVRLTLGGTGIDRTIYMLIGLAAIWQILCLKKVCGTCK